MPNQPNDQAGGYSYLVTLLPLFQTFATVNVIPADTGAAEWCFGTSFQVPYSHLASEGEFAVRLGHTGI